MSGIDDVLAAMNPLMDQLDQIVEEADDPWNQQQVDWAWFRLGTIANVLGTRQSGPLAAALARGLLEQAAYWDWAIGAGARDELIAGQCTTELARLRAAADPADTLWLSWVLPPGAEVRSVGSSSLPRLPSDAVDRLGQGLAAPVLAPLRFSGLFAAYRILEILSHGGLAASAIMRPGGGEELPEPLAAAVAHVAAAGGTATILSLLNTPTSAAAPIFKTLDEVARTASMVHGLPLGEARSVRTQAKSRPVPAATTASAITRLPPPDPGTKAASIAFTEAADAMAQTVMGHLRTGDRGTAIIWPCFQLAWWHLNTLRAVNNGTFSAAALPISARALLEDGTRWGWLRSRAALAPGGSLHSMAYDSCVRIERTLNALAKDALPATAIDHLLGSASALLDVEPTAALPHLDDMFAIANPSPEGLDACGPMYSVLSQFVHATPIAAMHLQLDEFQSISAPVHAVAVESACRGFWNTAITLAPMMCEDDPAIEQAIGNLTRSLGPVIRAAGAIHCIG